MNNPKEVPKLSQHGVISSLPKGQQWCWLAGGGEVPGRAKAMWESPAFKTMALEKHLQFMQQEK